MDTGRDARVVGLPTAFSRRYWMPTIAALKVRPEMRDGWSLYSIRDPLTGPPKKPALFAKELSGRRLSSRMMFTLTPITTYELL